MYSTSLLTSARLAILLAQDGAQATVGVLPALPYGTTALEPYIDNATTTIHWARHLNTYVVNLQYLVGNYTQLENYTLAELQRVAGTELLNGTASTTLINNGSAQQCTQHCLQQSPRMQTHGIAEHYCIHS